MEGGEGPIREISSQGSPAPFCAAPQNSSSLSLFCSPLGPGVKTFKLGKQFHCEKLNLVVVTGNEIPSFFPWYHFGHFIDFFSSSRLVVSGMRTPGSGGN